MAPERAKKQKVHRIRNYPFTLNTMISTEMAGEINRLAEAAEWPAAEVVRRALSVGLPAVERQLKLEEGQ